MDPITPLHQRIEQLEGELFDATEALRAIKSGEVDAIVVHAQDGDGQVFTLIGADRPYRTFVENMTDGAATVSAAGIVLYANRALAVLTGSTCPDIVGRPVGELIAAASLPAFAQLISGTGGSIDCLLKSLDRRNVPVRISAALYGQVDAERLTCLTIADLTQERRAEADRAHAAQHDGLTGLMNRKLLTERIRAALNRRPVTPGLMLVLFCDVDGFKTINDEFGHQVGDELLKIVARRLESAVRESDTVSRIGGDEFIIMCEGLIDMDAGFAVAGRIRDAVAAPVQQGSASINVTISIGMVVAEKDDPATPESLLRDSDEAMYKAKRQGPNIIEFFDDQLRHSASSQMRLLSDLRHAAGDHELRLHYQPVVDLSDETIIGVEALVRWQHPRRGLIQPDEFIVSAERGGMINDIGAWVIRRACSQAATWDADTAATAGLNMAINISGRQLAKGSDLVNLVRRALDEYDVKPGQLMLEVTESALMEDAEAALRVLNELKALGVRLAIDDFGTGYSSLVYLKRFPVDLLKIDRSFVAGLGRNADDGAIVRSVIDLAHAFAISTVAEGIETPQQLAILQDLGCTFGQGYLWSPAVDSTALGRLLIDQQSPEVRRRAMRVLG